SDPRPRRHRRCDHRPRLDAAHGPRHPWIVLRDHPECRSRNAAGGAACVQRRAPALSDRTALGVHQVELAVATATARAAAATARAAAATISVAITAAAPRGPAVAIVVTGARCHARNLDDACIQPCYALPLCRPTLYRHIGRSNAHGRAVRSDERDLGPLDQFLYRAQRARALGDVKRDGAEAAAILRGVIADRRALRVAVGGNGAHGGIASDDDHADDAIALPKPDALHALRDASGRWNL